MQLKVLEINQSAKAKNNHAKKEISIPKEEVCTRRKQVVSLD